MNTELNYRVTKLSIFRLLQFLFVNSHNAESTGGEAVACALYCWTKPLRGRIQKTKKSDLSAIIPLRAQARVRQLEELSHEQSTEKEIWFTVPEAC